MSENTIARGHGLPGIVGDRSTHNLWLEHCELRRRIRELAAHVRQAACCCGERDCPHRHELVRRLESL